MKSNLEKHNIVFVTTVKILINTRFFFNSSYEQSKRKWRQPATVTRHSRLQTGDRQLLN